MTLWALSMGALLGAYATGCADGESPSTTEQTTPSLAVGDATCAPDVSSPADGSVSDSACVRCPSSLSPCDATRLEAQASYDEVRASFMASCASPDAGSAFPIVRAGVCSPSGLRFLQIHHGLGMERRYFDKGGVFVGVLTESDYIDAVCGGLHEWPGHTSCDVQPATEVLCGSARP